MSQIPAATWWIPNLVESVKAHRPESGIIDTLPAPASRRSPGPHMEARASAEATLSTGFAFL